MPAHSVRVAHLACLGAILVAAACSSGGSSGYDDGVRNRFVAACTKASSGREAACAAAYACIRDRLPFADFKAADNDVAAGRPVDPATAQVLAQCAAENAPG
jgi:hypothetical protein